MFQETMNVDIIPLKEFESREFILISGLPGIAYIGKLSVEYLVQQLKAEKIAEVYSKYFPPYTLIKKDGEIKGVLINIRDITQRKKTEQKLLDDQEKLRSLSNELLLTEEQERRRIATDLHDSIGQTLAISKIKLGELNEFSDSVSVPCT